MERASYAPGTPSWVDLESPDTDASAAFYAGLFGWEATEPGPVEETGGYRMFLLRGQHVAGLGPQMNPGPPHWTSYVTVASCDAAAARVRELGGTTFFDPMDVLDVGRMCVFADPTGAVLALWEPRSHQGAALVNEPGTLCWNELSTRDVPAARAFYTGLFGWGTNESEGYTEWQLDGQAVGGMLETPPMVPAEVPAHWLVYFAVSDTDACVATAQSLGGTLVFGPMDIPVGRFATLLDPQGAMFAVITLA
jgi:predicted enzyme related to lactoylglutathione lyase